jgi:DNA uptake protein ComE-like DNA-binding protein
LNRFSALNILALIVVSAFFFCTNVCFSQEVEQDLCRYIPVIKEAYVTKVMLQEISSNEEVVKHFRDEVVKLKLENPDNIAIFAEDVLSRYGGLQIHKYIEAVSNFQEYMDEAAVTRIFGRGRANLRLRSESFSAEIIHEFINLLKDGKHGKLSIFLDAIEAEETKTGQNAFRIHLRSLRDALSHAVVHENVDKEFASSLLKRIIKLKNRCDLNINEFRENISAQFLNYDSVQVMSLITRIAANEISDLPSSLLRTRKVDINRASREEIMAIPGLKASVAREVVRFRESNGMFSSVRDLAKPGTIDKKSLRLLGLNAFAGDFIRPKKPWTVMVYVAADCDLEIMGLTQLNALERVGSTDNVNIVLQMDRVKKDVIADPNMRMLRKTWMDGNWVTSRRYYVEKDSDPTYVASSVIEKLGEVNTASPETLEDFGTYAVEHFPAEHFCLIVFGHGGGYNGVLPDANPDDIISIPDFGRAVKKIASGADSGKLDLLLFDSCLMSTLEVAWELEPSVNYMFATENRNFVPDSLNERFLRFLNENVGQLDPRGAAIEYLKIYVSSVKEWLKLSESFMPPTAFTATVLNLKRLSPVISELDTISRRVLESRENQKFFDSIFTDLLYMEQQPVEGFALNFAHFNPWGYDVVNVAAALKNSPDQALAESGRSLSEIFSYPEDLGNSNQIVLDFPETSPLVAEFHNELMPSARGLYLYSFTPQTIRNYSKNASFELTPAAQAAILKSFERFHNYFKLRLSRDTSYDELLKAVNGVN